MNEHESKMVCFNTNLNKSKLPLTNTSRVRYREVVNFDAKMYFDRLSRPFDNWTGN